MAAALRVVDTSAWIEWLTPEFDTNRAKCLICIEATSRRATTARAIERRARVF